MKTTSEIPTELVNSYSRKFYTLALPHMQKYKITCGGTKNWCAGAGVKAAELTNIRLSLIAGKDRESSSNMAR